MPRETVHDRGLAVSVRRARSAIGGGKPVSVAGLLDSGATVNVLPYSVGVQLGAVWDQQGTMVQLSGNLAACEARVLVVSAVIGNFPAVRLAFAWAKTDEVPVLLRRERNAQDQPFETVSWPVPGTSGGSA